MSVWLVSPAHGRLPISEVVYAQRAVMLKELRDGGIEAEALIVAEDRNIAFAERHGLKTLVHKNQPLGKKLNAGIQRALNGGADFVAFVGSDSIYLPAVFASLAKDVAHYGRWYTLAHTDVDEWTPLAVCDVPKPTWALNIYPRSLLRRVNGRPAGEGLERGLDGSIRNALGDYPERLVDVGQFQTVTLRSQPQITSNSRLIYTYGIRTAEIDELTQAGYDPATVEAIRQMYGYASDRVGAPPRQPLP